MNAERTDQLRKLIIEAPLRATRDETRRVVEDMALAVVRQKSGQDITDRHARSLISRYHGSLDAMSATAAA